MNEQKKESNKFLANMSEKAKKEILTIKLTREECLYTIQLLKDHFIEADIPPNMVLNIFNKFIKAA